MQKLSKKKIDTLLNHIENYNNEIEKQINAAMQMLDKTVNDINQEEKKFRDNVGKIKNIDSTDKCEEFINEICDEIPDYILMSQLSSPINDILNFTESSSIELKEFDLLAESALRDFLSDDQKRRLSDARIKKEKLIRDRQMLLQMIASYTIPMLNLSKEKWVFLWNLATWKTNLLLTKQMKEYTYVAALFTGIVAVLTILLVILTLIK